MALPTSTVLEAVNGKKGPDTQTIGFTGLPRSRGYLTDEYFGALSGAKKVAVYTKMRSDGMVQAILAALRLPVMAAAWDIEPAGKDANAKRAAELVEHQLFERLGCCWEEEVRNLLTCLIYGFSVSAKNWKIEKGEAVLAELRPLHPTTLLQGARSGGNWVFGPNGELEGVWQSGHDGERWRDEFIPAAAMVHLVIDSEFGSPEGRSLLRGAYKHHHIKDELYRLQAIGLERGAVGTPIAKYPANLSPEKQNELHLFCTGIASSENGGGTFPEGIEIENFSVETQTADIMAGIQHHDTKIAQAVLAQFLQLGTEGNGGAYALSADQTDLFLLSLEYIADYVAARINRVVIPEIVRYNVATDQYPKLSATVARQSATGLAAVLRPLVAGTNAPLTWGESDEDWLREQMQLPERTEKRPERVDPAKQIPGGPLGAAAAKNGAEEKPVEEKPEKPAEKMARERIELIVLRDPPSFREEPAYPELGRIAQDFHAAMIRESRLLQERVTRIARLPVEETLSRQFKRDSYPKLTPEQEADLDSAIESFIGTLYGDDLSAEGFAGTEAEDALVQGYERLAHSVGVERARRLTGAAAAAFAPTRDSPEIRQLLANAFLRLSDNGVLRIGKQLGGIKEVLVRGSLDGRSPNDVARDLQAKFTGYENYEWERLARTEAAFAANQGLVDECAAEDIEELENLVSALACPICQAHAGKRVKVKDAVVGRNIAPFHPNCMDSIIPVVE